MKKLFLRVVAILGALFSCPCLHAQTEVYTFLQDGVTPARQITFDIQPFSSSDDNHTVVVGMEGLSMAIIDEGHSIILDNGIEQFAVPPRLGGWYRLDVVKRYFSQDIEVSLDGYPAFLVVPKDSLDMFLPEDFLVVAGGMDSGPVIGSLTVLNLDEAPTSILDWGDLSSSVAVQSSESLESQSTSSTNPSPDSESITMESPGEAESSDPIENTNSRVKPERSSSSRLFTPLF